MNIVIVSDRVGEMPGMPEEPPVPVVKWKEICHSEHIGIHYTPFREVSRWKHVERKKPYEIRKWAKSRMGMASYSIGYAKSVEAAVAMAKAYEGA